MNRLLVIPSALFFILGIVGLMIPIVPQIPFFAFSVILLAGASSRFKRFLVSSKLYNKHFKKFIDKSEKLSEFMDDDVIELK